MAYNVNYNDERFQQVEAQKQAALNEVDVTYGQMIGASDSYYNAQIEASKDWADKQTQLQNEKTDFAIEQIEQQKAQEKKDYTREQSGAYVDWQKQSNEYGANAEQMADAGMNGTGYSESSQVSMFNTYQNRVATAREAYNLAIQNYNNAITEARMQNNSILAEIAYKALQQQLELSLAGFQYKNQLIMAKTDAKNAVENTYYGRYQDVLAQINHENAMAEEIRQYNASLAEDQRQFDTKLAQDQAQYNQTYLFNQKQHQDELALQREQMKEAQRQYNETLQLNKAKLAEEQRQFNENMAVQKSAQAVAAQRASKPKTASNSNKTVAQLKSTSGTKQTYKPSTGTFTGSTYKEAVDYMTKNGVPAAKASGVMTEKEWKDRKSRGSTAAQVKNYSSYKAYLKDYVVYATGK